jgi:DNA polymerase III sliding clamp (beta) subunit (PCNA family)
MKIALETQSLRRVLAAAERLCPSPAIGGRIAPHVRIVARKQEVAIDFTDFDHFCQVKTEAAILDEDGAALIPLARFLRFLAGQRGSHLHFCTTDSGVLVSSSTAAVEFHTPEVNEFPPLPDRASEVDPVTISAEEFLQALRHVLYATTRETQYCALDGVLFDIDEPNQFTVVTTDTKRMATYTASVQMERPCTWRNILVLPNGLRAIGVLLKLHSTDTVSLAYNASFLCVTSPLYTVWLRRLSGHYPDWKKVLPSQEPPIETEVDISELARLIRQIARAVDGAMQPVTLTVAQNTLYIGAESEAAKGCGRLPVRAIRDGEVALRVRARYLLEALHPIREKNALLGFYGPTQPIQIRAGGYRALLMPLATR